jgi:hypothetical protein
MVDIRQVREFERFRREHGSLKHHIVILDAGHVQRCVVARRLDADIAFPQLITQKYSRGIGRPIQRGRPIGFGSTRQQVPEHSARTSWHPTR